MFQDVDTDSEMMLKGTLRKMMAQAGLMSMGIREVCQSR